MIDIKDIPPLVEQAHPMEPDRLARVFGMTERRANSLLEAAWIMGTVYRIPGRVAYIPVWLGVKCYE